MQEKQHDSEFVTGVVSVVDDGAMRSVPTKPSSDMLAAGAVAGHVSVETAFLVYQAMVRACDPIS